MKNQQILKSPIAIEWEILDDLKKLLVNPKLSKDQPKALSVKDNVI